MDHPLRSPWIKGIVFLIGLSMVFVLGVMAGLALLDIRSTGAWLAGTEDAEDAEQAVVIARLTREVPDINNADNFTRARAEALRQILLEPDDLTRRYQMRLLIETIPLESIGEALRLLDDLPEGANRDALAREVLQHWGSLDGRSALAWAVEAEAQTDGEIAPPSGLVAAALAGWARTNPEEAWQVTLDFADRLVGEERLYLLQDVLHGIGQVDPVEAFRLALEQSDRADGYFLVEGTALELARTDLTTPLAMLVELPSSPARDNALAVLIREWALLDPFAASQLVDALRGDYAFNTAAAALAAEWRYRDPVEATDWAIRLPTGSTRALILEQTVGAWLDNDDVNNVAAWLDQFDPHPDLDGATRDIAFAMSELDHSAALSWATSMTPSSGQRDFTITTLGRNWMREDPEAAAAAIAADPTISNSTKQLILGVGAPSVPLTPENTPPPPQPDEPVTEFQIHTGETVTLPANSLFRINSETGEVQIILPPEVMVEGLDSAAEETSDEPPSEG